MTDEEKITSKLTELNVEILKMLESNEDPSGFLIDQYERQFDKLPLEAAGKYRTKWASYCREVTVIKNKNHKLTTQANKGNTSKSDLPQVGKHNGQIESFYLFWTKYEKRILNRSDLDDFEKQVILCDGLVLKDQMIVVSFDLADTKDYLFKKYRSQREIRFYIDEKFSNLLMKDQNDIDGLGKLIEAMQSALPLVKTADLGSQELSLRLFNLVFLSIHAKELTKQFWNDNPNNNKCPDSMFAFLKKQRENLMADLDARMSGDDLKKPNSNDAQIKQSKSKKNDEAKEQRQLAERISARMKVDDAIMNDFADSIFQNLITVLTGKFSQMTMQSVINSFSHMSTNNLLGHKWKIDPKDLTIHENKRLGKGSFGQVFKGTLTRGSTPGITVAVKKRLSKMTNEQMIEEAEKMKDFDHPNVLKMHGVCKKETDVYLVMEIMTENLHSYLENNLVYNTKLIVEQILNGLIYLVGRDCVHRDIASRNILVKDSLVKISDFGLTRKLAHDGTHTKNEHSKTLRNYSIAPEVFESQVDLHTVKSDVWSLGFVLWEIIAGGRVPFESLIAELEQKHSQPEERMTAFFEELKSGTRLRCPKHDKIYTKEKCPVYRIITDCWNFEPNSRPSYEFIKIMFSQIK